MVCKASTSEGVLHLAEVGLLQRMWVCCFCLISIGTIIICALGSDRNIRRQFIGKVKVCSIH